jgi:peptidoglycan-associated lipoprotein
MTTLPASTPATTRRAGRFAVLAAAALLAACASKVKLDDSQASVEDRKPTPVLASQQGSAAGGSAGPGQAAQSVVKNVDLGANAAGAASLDRTVYFDYDSFVVRDDYRGLLEGHSKALAGNKSRRLMLEGHTDERGGREYNLALGQKRAEAVLKAMTLVGADTTRLEAVSFGKERPAVEARDEAGFAKNRRVELKDK